MLGSSWKSDHCICWLSVTKLPTLLRNETLLHRTLYLMCNRVYWFHHLHTSDAVSFVTSIICFKMTNPINGRTPVGNLKMLSTNQIKRTNSLAGPVVWWLTARILDEFQQWTAALGLAITWGGGHRGHFVRKLGGGHFVRRRPSCQRAMRRPYKMATSSKKWPLSPSP